MKRSGLATLAGLLLFTATAATSAGPQKVLLWPNGAPGAMPAGGAETVRITEQGEHIISNVHQPSLTVYLPQAKHSGVAAFVLEYRLAKAPDSKYTIEGDALGDLKAADPVDRAGSRPDFAALVYPGSWPQQFVDWLRVEKFIVEETP